MYIKCLYCAYYQHAWVAWYMQPQKPGKIRRDLYVLNCLCLAFIFRKDLRFISENWLCLGPCSTDHRHMIREHSLDSCVRDMRKKADKKSRAHQPVLFALSCRQKASQPPFLLHMKLDPLELLQEHWLGQVRWLREQLTFPAEPFRCSHLPWGTHCAMGSSMWHLWIKKFPVFICTYLMLVDSVFWYGFTKSVTMIWVAMGVQFCQNNTLTVHSISLPFISVFSTFLPRNKQTKQNKPHIALKKGYNWLVVYIPGLSPSLVCP